MKINFTKLIVLLAFMFLGFSSSNIYAADVDNSWTNVKKEKVLTIGVSGDYAPWMETETNGKLKGYDIAVIKKICRDLGVKADFKTGQFAGLIPALNEGKYDIVMGGLQSTAERKKTLLLSKPYAEDGTVAVVLKNNKSINSIRDIKNKIIGASTGSSQQQDVEAIGKYKTLKGYKAPADTFNDLLLGRIDASAVGLVSAKNYIKTSSKGSRVKIAGKPYKSYKIVIALKKGSNSLDKKINKAIIKESNNGTLKKLQKKYLHVTDNNFK